MAEACTQVWVMEGVGYSQAMGKVALKPIQEDTRRYKWATQRNDWHICNKHTL